MGAIRGDSTGPFPPVAETAPVAPMPRKKMQGSEEDWN